MDAVEKPVAFLGGLNLNPHSLAKPGHVGAAKNQSQNHDVYVELSGPAVADVQHNFVQRWNEASERLKPGGSWGQNTDLLWQGIAVALDIKQYGMQNPPGLD